MSSASDSRSAHKAHFEAQLEALERMKLSSEFILFGIKENPSKVLRAIVTNIVFTLNIKFSPMILSSAFIFLHEATVFAY